MHPTAWVGEKNVRIGAGVNVGARASILERCAVGEGCVTGEGCVLGGVGFQTVHDGQRLLEMEQVGGAFAGHGAVINGNVEIG